MDEKKKAKVKMDVLIAAIAMIAITASTIAPAAAVFDVYGYVTFCNETAANNTTVSIKNMNTTEMGLDITQPDDPDNFYAFVFPDFGVESGNILCYNASLGAYKNIFNHTAPSPCFLLDFNITICGNVNCDVDDKVNVLDLIELRARVTFPVPPLNCEWAGNVNCNVDDKINVLDLIKLREKVAFPGTPLNCCTGCK